jgi:hypothetical protein
VKENIYLIPANTKKGMLIFNVFRVPDLILFATGLVTSFVLLTILGANDVASTTIVLAPALICAFLVLPIANYHNVITFLIIILMFLTNQRIYLWKGWCFYEWTGEEKK